MEMCVWFEEWAQIHGSRLPAHHLMGMSPLRGRKDYLRTDKILQVLAVVNVVIRFILVDAGLGRHFKDPSIGKANIMRYSYYLWMNQIINIIAVAILKWSICAYLLVLDFSKLYRVIVWFSIMMITALNFLAPVLTLFGCTPLQANWNRGLKGKCWAKGTLPLSYTQGISNILTDGTFVLFPTLRKGRVTDFSLQLYTWWHQ
jgi:hypothetical protein